MKKIYLDYAATSPVDPSVVKAMLPYLTDKFGNTMSLHSFGQEAKIALEKSREVVANLIGAKPNEIIFTGSATESNNMVLKGLPVGRQGIKGNPAHLAGRHIIISSIEHPCIIETAEWLEKKGVKVTRIPVDKKGLINPLDIEKAITKDTTLVSIIHGSNEIGTIQPIEEIGKICKKHNVYFHTDAVQTFGKVPIDIANIDLLTASSHKICGPKGVACLFIKEGVGIEPLLHGGGQENGLRSSTVNVAGVVGFAKACQLCAEEREKEGLRLTKLRDKIIKNVLKIDKAYLTGHNKKRLPNNASFIFSFIEGESLAIQLDLNGIAVSTGSACSSMKLEPNHVLLATGLKPAEAHGSLRVSLGRWTTEEDIDQLIKILPGIVNKLREISPYGK